jgi:D-alanyl-D-alanine carboxypeptidase
MNRNTLLGLAVFAIGCAAPKPFDPAAIECDAPPSDTSAAHPRAAEYQAELDRLRTAGGLPGVVLGIRDNDGTWFGASGYAHLESKTPMKTCHRVRVGSITKTFTAAGVMKLADEGKLSIDDSIGRWIPADIARTLKHADQITIRHLLTHSSGLQDPLATEFSVVNSPDERMSREQCVAKMSEFDPQQVPPGEVFRYTSNGFNLLAMHVMAAANGTSADEAMQRTVLRPLELHSTSFRDSPGEPTGAVPSYGEFFNDGTSIRTDQWFHHWSTRCQGVIVSNAYDLMTFITALERDKTLLSAVSTQALMTHHGPTGYLYGFGVDLVKTPFGVAIGHSGINNWSYRSFAYHFPDRGVTIVLLYNTANATISDVHEAELFWGYFDQVMELVFANANL